MSIRMRVKENEGVVEVKALMKHPMETGQRQDSDGNTIPAHYIHHVVVTANGDTVLDADWGPSISADPYLSFEYKGAKGDKIVLTWTDNKGETDSAESEAS